MYDLSIKLSPFVYVDQPILFKYLNQFEKQRLSCKAWRTLWAYKDTWLDISFIKKEKISNFHLLSKIIELFCQIIYLYYQPSVSKNLSSVFRLYVVTYLFCSNGNLKFK